jgi:hypothetical protein
MSGLLCDTAMAPYDPAVGLSNTCVNEPPAFSVFQTPPVAATA